MLKVEHLSIEFYNRRRGERVVKDVSFSMEMGEILGIVGESGSGKTMTAQAVAGLLSLHAQIHPDSKILFQGQNLLSFTPKQWAFIQGKDIGVVFQEPMTALDPTMRIGRQIGEPLRIHDRKLGKEERKRRVLDAMRDVELPGVEMLARKYPHELSGGMRQRAMIASAIICRPRLLIADEPTTALDVNTQEQILQLLKKLNRKYHMGILFISHNLRVVKALCQRVLVMKDGEIIEEGDGAQLFVNPKHRYTKALVDAIPAHLNEELYVQLLGGKDIG